MAVTPAMIAVALGVAAPQSGSLTEQQWQMWIEDALMLIEIRKAELSRADDAIDAAKLDYVVREAVVAQARRPDSATQVTVSVDDGSTSKTYASGKGRVTILDEWWTLLGLLPDGGQAYTVDTVGSAQSIHLPWCSLAFGATCSCGASIAGFPIYENAPDL